MADATLRDLIEEVRKSAEKDQNKYEADLKLGEMQKKLAAIQTNYYTKDSVATKQLTNAFDRLTDIYNNNNGVVKENARKQIEALEAVVESQEKAAAAGEANEAAKLAEILKANEEKMSKTVKQLDEFANMSLKEAEEKLKILELDKQLKGLQKNYFVDNDQSEALRAEFERLVEITQNGDEQQKELASKQIAALQATVGTEEDAAEKKKAVADQTNALMNVAAGLEGFEKSLESFADGAAKGAFGLSALLLLFDPKTLISGILGVLEFIKEGFSAISALIQGDTEAFFDFFTENFLAVMGTLTFFAVKFGVLSAVANGFRNVVSAWRWAQTSLQTGLLRQAIDLAATAKGKIASGITTAIRLVRTGMIAVGSFMSGTVFPAIMGAISAAGAAIAPILVAAAPFVAIGAAIAAAVYAIYESFDKAFSVFESTGSITEAMGTFFIELITAPIRWAKDLVSWALGALGFENAEKALDEIDITASIISGIKGMFTGVIDWVNETFNINIGESLATLWQEITGGMGLIGLFTAHIRAAGDWIAKLFGFEAPEGSGEGFVTAKIKELYENLKNWLADIIPSFGDITGFFSKLNPFSDDEPEETVPAKAKENKGLFGFGDEPEKKPEDLDAQIARAMAEKKRAEADLAFASDDEKFFDANPNAYSLEQDRAKMFAKLDIQEADAKLEKLNAIKSAREMLIHQKPVSALRDNQVENNDLQAANNTSAAVVIQQQAAQKQTPPANVKASTVNVSNNVDLDRMASMFAFEPSF